MNRYSRVAAAAVLMVGGLGAVGCTHTEHGIGGGDRYRNVVDTSWPERYSYDARRAVLAPFAQQVANGQVVHYTLWNWYFEPGSDRLHPAGMDRLDAISLQNPGTRIYLQTANDIVLSPDNANKIHELRDELNTKRAKVIEQYLASKPGAPSFELAIHNGPVPKLYAPFATAALRSQVQSYRGGLGGGGGGGAVSVSSGSSLSGGSGGSVGPAGGAGGGSTPAPSGGPMGGGGPTGP